MRVAGHHAVVDPHHATIGGGRRQDVADLLNNWIVRLAVLSIVRIVARAWKELVDASLDSRRDALAQRGSLGREALLFSSGREFGVDVIARLGFEGHREVSNQYREQIARGEILDRAGITVQCANPFKLQRSGAGIARRRRWRIFCSRREPGRDKSCHELRDRVRQGVRRVHHRYRDSPLRSLRG